MEVIIPLRPLTIHVPEERREIYERMKVLLNRVEHIINSTYDERLKIRAIECAVKIASLLKDVLEDVQIDKLEEEVAEIEKSLEKG